MISIARYYEQDILMEVEIDEIVNKLKENVGSKFIEDYKTKIANMKKSLVDAGVDIKQFEQFVESKSILAAQKLKEGDRQGFFDIVKEIFAEIKQSSLFKQIGISLLLVMAVLIINSVALSALVVGFSIEPPLAFLLMAIFMAPLTEETGKFLSVKYGATGVHFIIFNTFEFSTYMVRLVNAGVPIIPAVIGRLMTVLLHLSLTTIHFKAKKNKEELKGWGTAAGIHFLWNLFPTLLGQILK